MMPVSFLPVFIGSIWALSLFCCRIIDPIRCCPVQATFFVVLGWAQTQELPMQVPGTVSVGVLLYTLLLTFILYEWELQERRDFCLTEVLAAENVEVQMQMEVCYLDVAVASLLFMLLLLHIVIYRRCCYQMTGWFSGGIGEQGSGGLHSAGTHIDPHEIEMLGELGQGSFGTVLKGKWKETGTTTVQISAFVVVE